MKKLCCAIIALMTIAFVNAQTFEGSYLMHIENANQKNAADMQVAYKGDKSSMEMLTAPNAGKFRTIFDNKEKTMTILVEKDGTNKMAMVRKMQDASEVPGNKEGKDAKITVTDETKKIEGYTCKKVIAESDESTSEMWVTDELGLTYADMFGMMRNGRGPASNMSTNMQNYKDVKGIPLEMNIRNKVKPDESMVITIKNIKKGNVDASLFDISGYKVMDMQNMGGGH
ncbi:MAG TPA: DUF4412 domain-containing protein [Bacteroidia bacterium]|nr:DUF4412 domain-containing protein [Bacteroidia bacterium]